MPPATNSPTVPKKNRVLALCDTPTVRPEGIPGAQATTGFGTVGKNIFKHWSADGVAVDVWALHFDGWGYGDVPYKLFPAGKDWTSPAMLTAFLQKLCTGDYTHVWMLMNPETLSVGNNFPVALAACCKKYGIHSTLYFPMDADVLPGDGPWFEIVRAVDVAVTFTEYGRLEAIKGLKQPRTGLATPAPLPEIKVIAHGADEIFCNLETRHGESRQKLREKFLVCDDPSDKTPGAKSHPFLKPDDFCIVAVNKNEWRKDLLRTLEIVKRLIDAGVPAKLILRCAPAGAPGCGGIPIEHAATALGLRANVDWTRMDPLPPSELVALYNVGDLYVTTSMGEGWGLGIVEALMCGSPVALPLHTSCGEIGKTIMQLNGEKHPHYSCIPLHLEEGCAMGYENRLRHRVDLEAAVSAIKFLYEQRKGTCVRVTLKPAVVEWLSWKRIADEFLKLMRIEAKAEILKAEN